MNWTLLKNFVKKNWTLWAIFTGVCCFYLIIMTVTKEMLDDVMGNMMPTGFAADNILTYIATVYFDSILTMLPMVYYVWVAYKLVAKTVDNTAMSTYLTAGISRNKYMLTATIFLLGSILLMFAVLFGLGMICMSAIESFSIANFSNVVISSMLCTMFLAMISFFMGSFFAGTKLGLPLTIAAPVALLIIFMIGESLASITWLEWVQYLTPFGWIDMAKISTGTYDLLWLVQLGYIIGIGTLVYLSTFFFKRKQLSI